METKIKSHLIILFLLLSLTGLSQNYIYTATPVDNGTQNFHLDGAVSAKSRHTLFFLLPDNTVRWYYVFSASRNQADIDRVTTTYNLLAKLSHLYDRSGITSDVIQLLGKPPGSDYCDAIFLNSIQDADAFGKKSDYFGKGYKYVQQYSSKNLMSGTIEVLDGSRQKDWQYLGFRNPSTSSINVSVQVVAIVRTEETINGWTKSQKDILYNTLKKVAESKGHLSEDDANKIVDCLSNKITAKYTMEQLQGLANYELNDALTNIFKDCQNELGIKISNP